MKNWFAAAAEDGGRCVPAIFYAGTLVLAGAATDGVGDEAMDAKDRDKSKYTLFRPTPHEEVRELTTDRPDKTESPFTVDAGHFQVEADVVNYAYDRYNSARADTRVETVRIAPLNLKAGIRNDMDVQLVLDAYVSVRTHELQTGAVHNDRGLGDLLIRGKWNAWGNDGGSTAFAVMPYVKLPVNQDNLGNNAIEGGAIFPLAFELPAGWSAGLMTQFDVVRDASRSRYHPEFLNSITFGRDIVGDLGGYAEFFSAVSTELDAAWVGTVDFGLTYRLTRDIQLDAGVNIGLTRAADDLNPFMGISWRF